MSNHESRYILLVEDDEVDRMTVKRAIKKLKIPNDLVTAENGEEALDLLHSSKELPWFILMDINMPRMNGLELLKIMKSDERLKIIPIIMLTTSAQDEDRYESFQNSVAGYVIKPVEFQDFMDAIDRIHKYWIMVDSPDDF
ncbi:MAG: CheY-like chemotaxis protein [Cognaticolwellia sp.]|jgi:CheY-like chemotaxis protein|tara:strand:+ start:146 stop:568 length:423 start_codon:yes stop_codon:yes gene_type:complete